ncbi:MAG: PspC domain-containing protein [Candidatus Nanopelagicales bacterium]
MTENQPTIAEPVDPSGSATGASENPGAGSAGPTYAPPPPYAAPYPPAKPPLRRSRADRVLTGVCGGLAENLGIDAVLIRILVVVGTVFTGGALIIAYLIAWALMPDTPAYVVPVQPAPAGAPASFAAGGTGTYVDPSTGAVYGPPTPAAAAPRTEPRSYLGLVTLSAAVVVGGLFALAGALGASISGLVVAASLLLVLGIGLLVGAVRGRARWLIAPAIVMVLFVQGAAAVQNVVDNAGSGVGDRTWTPTASESSFGLGAGEARLDLARLPAGPASVDVSVGAGHVIVYVPADTAVTVEASVGLGEIDLPGERPTSGADLAITQEVPATSTGGATTTVDLTVQVGLGQLEVRRAAS